MVRFLLVLVAGLSCASFAWAQQAVSIPFAPSLPSTFVIDETRTVHVIIGDVDTVRVAHARYTFELRARGDSYRAVLSLVSVEELTDQPGEDGSAPIGIALPSRALIGLPVELTLRSSGEPGELLNAEAVQQRFRAERENSGSFESPVYERVPALLVGIVAAPLAAVSPCQNTSLTLNDPVTRESETPIETTTLVRVVRTEKVLRSVNQESGLARVEFNRVQGARERDSDPNAILQHQLSIHATCDVDLESGVTRSAIVEMTSPDAFTLRSELTVTPQ